MKIFALDTSSKVATLAILEDGKVLLENTVNDKKTHSEQLMPMIEAAFERMNLTPADMDVFGVTLGPGAFTGLRIGISTVKGMAEALDKPVVGLSAPEVLAGGIAPTDRIVCPILDAQREQVYTGFFSYERIEEGDGAGDNNPKDRTLGWVPLSEIKVMKVRDLIKEAAGMERKILFVGDGLELHENTLREGLGEAFEKPLHGNGIPRASVAGALTERKHRQGRSHKGETLKPVYLRKSQAEVQFDERQKSLGKEAEE